MTDKRKIIIMVDDNITNLNVARNALIDKYDIFTVPSGNKLFQILEKIMPDLILLDVDMPEMNGYEVIKRLKGNKATCHIPVIFLTALDDSKDELEGLTLGAIDYITKPFSPPLLLKRVEVHLLVEFQKRELEDYNSNLEQMIMAKAKTVFELQNAVLKTVAELVEFRDDVTGCHIERTQGYLRLLVNAMMERGIYREEISSWDINFFILSAQLHDVGKIAIKDSILLKPSKLTDKEFEEMKGHTVTGAKIIRQIEKSTKENSFLMHAEILAFSHHEKWDGTGYPLGVKGEEIPLQGRLMAIVDVYDALTNDRPYKKAYSHEEAVEIIKSEIGTRFDPQIGKVFLECEQEFKDAAEVGVLISDMTQEESKAICDLQLTLSRTLSEIADYRGGIVSANRQIDRMRSYIKIFVNALSENEYYTGPVSTWDIELFILSAQLHDVGKIAIKDGILHKPAGLTTEEFRKIKEHTDFGVRVVKKIGDDIGESNFFEHAEGMVGGHHERWDGTGYPLGLKGEDIPLQGRVMAIIDVYDAITSDRPYKDAASHEEAVEIIKSERGTGFDPRLVDIFLEREKDFRDVNTNRP